MRRPVQLERFADHNRTTPIEAPDVAEIRQATYEAGHRDGWKACEGTLEAGDARMREAVGAHLQALSFTYQEARDQTLSGLRPLLVEIVSKVLPTLARDTLLPKVLEQLLPFAEQGTARPVTIQVPPDAKAAAEDFLSRAAGLPFVVQARPDLNAGQAVLSSGNQEQMLDLDGAIQVIALAINDFFNANWPDSAPSTDIEHD